jgi:hypothetical protein
MAKLIGFPKKPRPRTTGVEDEVKLQMAQVLGQMMRHINQLQEDIKPRHFICMIVTNEGVDHVGGGVTVSTDLISSMDAEETHELMRDWLNRQTQ